MQVIPLFLSVNVLLTGIGLIFVALIAVEIKADNTVDYQKQVRETASFRSMLSIKLL